MAVNRIAPETMQEGFEYLDQLALGEYARNLAELVESLKEERGADRMYFGRLLGIVIKEPFSEIDPTPELHGTKRRWELKPDRLKEQSAQSTWQFQIVKQLQTESLEYEVESFPSLEEMAEEVKRETGFFWHLLRSLRKYICRDAQFSKQLKEEIDKLNQTGTPSKLPTTSMAAATLGTMLATQIPWLGIAGAPLITGVVLLVWQIGGDAFCSWSDDLIKSRVWYRDS